MDHQKFDFSELWITRNMPFRILDYPKNEINKILDTEINHPKCVVVN